MTQDFSDDVAIVEMYYHLLWSTKDQRSPISCSCASQLYSLIYDLALSVKCHVIEGQVFSDHVQLVVKGSSDTSLENLMTNFKLGTVLS
ncbi:MAG: transposase [Parachlamydiaceae bacterium]